MADKVACKYCGEKYAPGKLMKHVRECKKDQKIGAVAIPPKFPKWCIVKTCPKCGAQSGIIKLDGAKCNSCGADL
jgi:DnaJ-class molecular chaperone